MEKGQCIHYLASQLVGRAKLASGAMSITNAGSRYKIKEAVPTRYNINEEADFSWLRGMMEKKTTSLASA